MGRALYGFGTLAGVVFVIVACKPPGFEGDEIPDVPGTAKPIEASHSADCSAAPAFAPQDPASLPACACDSGGKARCVAKDKIVSALADQLETCSGGVCLPDSLVASGIGAPTTCMSSFGEGRCMSLCMPEIAKKASLLTRAECAEDERCVPCKNPLNGGAPTGVCEIGKPAPVCAGKDEPKAPPASTPPPISCPYTGPPIVDVTTFPSCGDGARCVPENLVPEASRAQLRACPNGLCAPEKSVAAAGQYLPKTCRSLANAEGRCLNVNIPAVDAQKASLPSAGCDASERCVPCFSPIDGRDTGACRSVSCDSPREAGVRFRECCSDSGVPRGKCVPASMIPYERREKLDDDDGTCFAGDLCAPSESLDPNYQYPRCTAFNLLQGGTYSGVCLSNCINFSLIELLATRQGSCADEYTCVPCFRDGEPTGAPGCQ
jgi:hypothetical protein